MRSKHAKRSLAARLLVTAGAIAGVVLGVGPAFASTASPVSKAAVVSCPSQLKVMRDVSRQAGLRIGSTQTIASTTTAHESWARELHAAGLTELGMAARGIRNKRSDHDFVVAMTATADYMLTKGCPAPVLRFTGLPTWFSWERGPSHNGFACMVVWGGTGDTTARVCADGKAWTS